MKKGILCCLLIYCMFISQMSLACTILSCAMHGEAYAAANEDDYTPFIRIWFNPASKERYGSVCFGAPDLQIATAMNEYGLFYDYTAQYSIDAAKYQLKNPYNGDLFFEIISKCKTVDEALAFLEKHDYTATSQVLLADATGASVVIHVGAKVKKTGIYQINTNFDILNVPTHNYSCGRYDIAERMLSSAKSLSVPFLRDILNETHQEGALSTQYSNVYDLKRGKIYVYLFHNYSHVYEIDLKKELAKGYRLEMLADHFPVSFAYQSYVQSHPLYRKETIMSEIRKKGVSTTVTKYISELNNSNTTKVDSALVLSLLEVGIQLIKDANNQHTNGQMWEYWFSLPNGYYVKQYDDERIHSASQLLVALLNKAWNDVKYKNFILEMLAYCDMVESKPSVAIERYQKLIVDPSQTFPVTYNRSREMLSRIKR
ncbi:carcinine hydrolase/isopenicillin-N N-acyltransferase family protein [Xanthocytophaga agilis]|uniref:Peptidase C45 hydrolase domain-containing protein n=1 Tax=Xanthocytophaga agilis TaxID=3048010 RepID=A0AAE3R1R3_9BACT|nr:hypothetical protein [Xanthocytophaga agilis]MDJ1500029.1 hypothetical protein [Xanthocytophaga agilis]